MARREELVIALLAVLKAGCAYVPLDPGYPSGACATRSKTRSSRW
jgi:non-ribosomal peptide synthetase component F